MGTRPVALQLCGRKINKGREERAGEVTRGGEKMEVWKRKVVVCAACGSKVVRNRDRERAHTWRASHHREPAWRCWRRPSQALRASRAAAVWQRCGFRYAKKSPNARKRRKVMFRTLPTRPLPKAQCVRPLPLQVRAPLLIQPRHARSICRPPSTHRVVVSPPPNARAATAHKFLPLAKKMLPLPPHL